LQAKMFHQLDQM